MSARHKRILASLAALACIAGFFVGQRWRRPVAVVRPAEVEPPPAADPIEAPVAPSSMPVAAHAPPPIPTTDAATAAPQEDPPEPVVFLDSDGRPLLQGKLADPDSDEYKKLVPPGVKLPTRAEVEQKLAELQPAAEDCFRAHEDASKGGVIATRFFFHGGDAPAIPEQMSVPDQPAAASLHERLSQGSSRDGQLRMTLKGAWQWSVYHEFKIPPR